MKLSRALITCFFIVSAIVAYGQNSVGIGVANPNKNAVLELISPGNNQGILIPKLTTAQRTASSFTGGLSTKENGLMVFDSDEKKFYYWEASQWKALGTGSELSGGTGVTIVNNTISTVPQDLQLTGSTLKITNNPAATDINLGTAFTQDLQLTGSTLKITNNPAATDINLGNTFTQDLKLVGSTLTLTNNAAAVPINLSDINIPQDLQLTGSQLTITNNPSATPINLSAFTGTNTDDQTLSYNGGTGVLSITRLTGGPQTVTIPTTTPPSGGAGGDLSGTFPNPTVANNAINSAKIADGTITGGDILNETIASADILDGSVASADIADGTITTTDILNETIASADILDGTIAASDLGALSVTDAKIATGVTVSKLTAGTAGQVLTTVGTVTTWANAPAASGTAGGDLTGTYPNPTVTANAITSGKIADETIASADILDGTIGSTDIGPLAVTDAKIATGVTVSKLTAGTAGQVLTTVGTVTTWAAAPTATGTAGGDLTGTYPNPTVNNSTITSAKIVDGAIVDGDINGTANIAVTKLLAGSTGQVLTTTAGGIAWAAAPTATGAAGGDLTGTYPNPTVTANAITSGKIADETIASADILDGTIGTTDIGPLAVTDAKIATGVTVSKLTAGTAGQVLTTVGTVTTWAAAPTATGTAGGDLTGTYPNPTVNNSTITSAKIVDGAIVDGDINGTANIAVTKLLAGSTGQVLTTTAGGIAWAAAPAPSGAAGGDLTGTYPNPTIAANAVTSTEIAALTIDNTDISAAAAIAVSKLAASANDNYVLTSIGSTALWAAPGGSALISAPASQNLWAGVNAGQAGDDNSFFGFNAGNITTGSWNVAVGSQAGRGNSTGTLNTLVGWVAGGSLAADGSFNGNTMIGAEAGRNTTGGPNTFIGEKAGFSNNSGTQNVFVGNSAGTTNQNGAQNTIIGYFANVSGPGFSNATAIGYNTTVNASNKVRIGNAAVGVIEGQVAFTAASDRRLKTNIRPIENGLDFILKMKPVAYTMKTLDDKRTNWGFIAQDIQLLVGDDNAVVTVGGDKDKTLGLRYTDFVAPLVKAVQEQQDQISDLNDKLTESEKKVDLLMAEIEKLKKAVGLKAENK